MSILDFDPKIHFITDSETGKRITIYEFWDHCISYKEGRKEGKRTDKWKSMFSKAPHKQPRDASLVTISTDME